MIRLGLIAATGFLALALTACGEHGNSKPVSTENMQQQQGAAPAPAPQQQPAGESH